MSKGNGADSHAKGDAFEEAKRIQENESAAEEHSINGASVNMDAVVVPLVPSICTASFWINRKLDYGEPLIRPWLYPGENYMVWGKRGSGKSEILLSIMFAGATGKPFGKWTPTKRVRTAYFDFEMSQIDLQIRISEMVEHFRDPGENLLAISTIDFPQIHPIDNYRNLGHFLKILDDHRPEIIGMDNIQSSVSQSIKSGDAFNGLKPVNTAIRRRRTCAIWGHHAGFSDEHHYGDSQFDCEQPEP